MGTPQPTRRMAQSATAYYISTDAIITATDVRLDGIVNTNSQLPAGGGWALGAPTPTIPSGTAPGNYFIGILVDELNEVT